MQSCARMLMTCLIVFLSFVSAHGDDATNNCTGARYTEPRPKVVGGWRGQIKHWPGLAVFRLHNPNTRESAYECGGTLIAPKWVLTAAHCFVEFEEHIEIGYFEKNANGHYVSDMSDGGYDEAPLKFSGTGQLEVILGTDDLQNVKEENIRRVANVIVHPEYRNGKVSGHDIALLELDAPYDGPIAQLSSETETDPATPPGTIAMVAGFGSEQWRAPLTLFSTPTGAPFAASSKVLREVDLPTVSQKKCKERHPNYEIGPGQICAGFERGRKDTCQNDSGGPMVAFDRYGCAYQIGIVSWGPKCASLRSYGVYTRVSAYYSWIKSHVPDLRFVKKEDVVTQQGQKDQFARADAFVSHISRILDPAKDRVELTIQRRRDGQDTKHNQIPLNKDFSFRVESDVAGQLIVLDINAVGQVTQIFPNKYVTKDAVGIIEAGQRVQMPDTGYGFDWFRAAEPLGEGRLIVLVVPDEFSELYPWETKTFRPEESSLAFLANYLDQIYGLTKAGEVSARPVVASWAIQVVPYEIVP